MNGTDEVADVAALASCAAGDASALTALFRRHGAACFGLARSVVGDARLAEDVVRAVYVGLWQQAARFEVCRPTTRVWLLTSTHRRAVDAVRAHRCGTKKQPSPGVAAGEERLCPEAAALAATLGTEVLQALAALTAAQREVLVLAYWDCRTEREIAALTGTSLEVVRMRMCEAMTALSHGVPAPSAQR